MRICGNLRMLSYRRPDDYEDTNTEVSSTDLHVSEQDAAGDAAVDELVEKMDDKGMDAEDVHTKKKKRTRRF